MTPTDPIELDVARLQNTVSWGDNALPAVPVPCGELVTSVQFAAFVPRVTVCFAVSTIKRPMSSVWCVGQATVRAPVPFTAVPATWKVGAGASPTSLNATIVEARSRVVEDIAGSVVSVVAVKMRNSPRASMLVEVAPPTNVDEVELKVV